MKEIVRAIQLRF